MTDSLPALGTPTRWTDSLTRSYVRTDVRTNEEPPSPSSETSPSVTRTRAYRIAVVNR